MSCWLTGVANAQPETRFYQDIGRLTSQFPADGHFFWAVPHFTQGPRVLCGEAMQADCEIQVSARDLTVSRPRRREDLIKSMQAYKADAKEATIDILTAGSTDFPVEYVSLTHKVDGGRVAVGHYVKGPFAIKFHFVGRDPTGEKLQRVLSLLGTVTALDADAYLAFKLVDYKAGCDLLMPAFRADNEQAWRASTLSRVDYKALIANAQLTGQKALQETDFDKIQRLTADSMREWGAPATEAFCRTLPRQMAEAMR
ncbi:MAG TPA: hypothetical protein VFW93_07550 [Aquabacterium sp.]|uniref:hypothetical protein n=1 Tax=Aquabacterium sp. TaxID=1872578 RepID=UPI002E308BFB|nr:hypothetical protein [Aquabacterium sp.]HEX5356056.1 hypothetical protein [Aquabacterium sp.]